MKIHPKRLGDIAEIIFLLRCMALGLVVARPYGDCDPFDFIVYSPFTQRMLRVQVRCSASINNYTYSVQARMRGSARRYTRKTLDLMAVYVLPHNAWYIIPVEKLKGSRVCCSPHLKTSNRWTERYREAWHLLM